MPEFTAISNADPGALVSDLNQHASGGWEVVSVVESGGTGPRGPATRRQPAAAAAAAAPVVAAAASGPPSRARCCPGGSHAHRVRGASDGRGGPTPSNANRRDHPHAGGLVPDPSAGTRCATGMGSPGPSTSRARASSSPTLRPPSSAGARAPAGERTARADAQRSQIPLAALRSRRGTGRQLSSGHVSMRQGMAPCRPKTRTHP